MGSWDWTGYNADNPLDHIGVTTSNKTSMPIQEVIINGYDRFGEKTAHMNSEISTSREGYVQLEAEEAGGVSFWIDEYYVDNGSISAYLGGLSSSTTDEVRIEYEWTTTDTTVTGVGGAVDVKSGGGFNITWKQDVENSHAESAGADYTDL